MASAMATASASSPTAHPTRAGGKRTCARDMAYTMTVRATSTREALRMEISMATAPTHGHPKISTLAAGWTTRGAAGETSPVRMEPSIKATTKTTREMVQAPSTILTLRSTGATGRMIGSADTATGSLLTRLATVADSTRRVSSTEKVSMSLQRINTTLATG